MSKTKYQDDIPLTELQTPFVPNRIRLRSGGFVPIDRLRDVQLKILAARWAHELLDYANARRSAKKKSRSHRKPKAEVTTGTEQINLQDSHDSSK